MSNKTLVVTVVDPTHFSVSIHGEAFTQKARAIELAAKVTQVKDADQQQEAVNALAAINGLLAGVEKTREEVKKPFLDAGKLIDGKAKEYIKELLEQKAALSKLISDYQLAERRRIEAEERAEQDRKNQAQQAARAEEARLEQLRQQEAAAKSTKERKRLADERAQAELDAQEAREHAQEVASASSTPQEVAKSTGASVRAGFDIELTDADDFAKWDYHRRKDAQAQGRILPRFTKVEIALRDFKEFVALLTDEQIAAIPGVKITPKFTPAVHAVSPTLALK